MRYDVVIIGGGQSGSALGVQLLSAGKKVCMISAGGFLGPCEMKLRFSTMGGDCLSNSRAVSYSMDDGRVRSVTTDNSITVEADVFVLSTGRFFSKGLVSDMDRIYEPLFGLDVFYDPDPQKWTSPDFYEAQLFESFGVMVSSDGVALKGGKPVDNLYVCGEILCGNEDIIKSVERVCRNIR